MSFCTDEGERELGEEYVICTLECRKTLSSETKYYYEYSHPFIRSLVPLHCASIIKGNNTPINGNTCAGLTGINTENSGTERDKTVRPVSDNAVVQQRKQESEYTAEKHPFFSLISTEVTCRMPPIQKSPRQTRLPSRAVYWFNSKVAPPV